MSSGLRPNGLRLSARQSEIAQILTGLWLTRASRSERARDGFSSRDDVSSPVLRALCFRRRGGHAGRFQRRQKASVTVTEGLGASKTWKSVAVSDPWTV